MGRLPVVSITVVRFDDPECPRRQFARGRVVPRVRVNRYRSSSRRWTRAGTRRRLRGPRRRRGEAAAVKPPYVDRPSARPLARRPPRSRKLGNTSQAPGRRGSQAHVLPRRFRPIAEAIAYAADRPGATSAPPFAANLVVDASVGALRGRRVGRRAVVRASLRRSNDGVRARYCRNVRRSVREPSRGIRDRASVARSSRSANPGVHLEPVVFAAGEGGDFGGGQSHRGGRPALTLKAVASNSSSHHVASSEASDGWRLRSAAVGRRP